MAFGLDDPGKQRAFLFVILILGGGYLFFRYMLSPLRDERLVLDDRIAVLEQHNSQATALTQVGRIEDLRRREAEYEIVLDAYATLLPREAEVPGLLEEIAMRALQERVVIVNFTPLDDTIGEHLVEIPYELQVQGAYHDIGRLLASIANLPRLVRPVVTVLEQEEIAPVDDDEETTYEVLATIRLSTFVPNDPGGAVQRDPEPAVGDQTSQARQEADDDVG